MLIKALDKRDSQLGPADVEHHRVRGALDQTAAKRVDVEIACALNVRARDESFQPDRLEHQMNLSPRFVV
jgi:hypothetical protein